MLGMNEKDILPGLLAHVWFSLALLALFVLGIAAAFSEATQAWVLANWKAWLVACAGSALPQVLTVLLCKVETLKQDSVIGTLLLLAGITGSSAGALALSGILALFA
jgi:hypothetical protein